MFGPKELKLVYQRVNQRTYHSYWKYHLCQRTSQGDKTRSRRTTKQIRIRHCSIVHYSKRISVSDDGNVHEQWIYYCQDKCFHFVPEHSFNKAANDLRLFFSASLVFRLKN